MDQHSQHEGRHCERSEAIQPLLKNWIASSQALLAMTTTLRDAK
jgi:hypothetical protein